jgi:hypothetical protein
LLMLFGARTFATALFFSDLVISAQEREPSLSEFTAAEQTSIRNACRVAGLSGPASLYACLTEQIADLRRSSGPPDLSDFSPGEQDSMRSACRDAGLSGPASSYACLTEQVADLRRSSGPPDLSDFSPSEQASIRNACRVAGLSGPASLYACFNAVADLPRWQRVSPRIVDTPREHDLSPPVVTPRSPIIQGRAQPNPTASPANGQSTDVIAQPRVRIPNSLSDSTNPSPNTDRTWGWLFALSVIGLFVVRYFAASQTREKEVAQQGADARDSPDPYAILGVPPNASQTQIRAAYRELVAQYHPDKVAQLGPELQRLAARKTQQINDAYRSLKR